MSGTLALCIVFWLPRDAVQSARLCPRQRHFRQLAVILGNEPSLRFTADALDAFAPLRVAGFLLLQYRCQPGHRLCLEGSFQSSCSPDGLGAIEGRPMKVLEPARTCQLTLLFWQVVAISKPR